MKHFKDILFVAPFNQMSASTPCRAQSVINVFRGSADMITFITTDFDHGRKRPKGELPIDVGGVKCKYLHVSIYDKNLSVGRLRSHCEFAIGLNKYLKSLPTSPDFVYCAMPTSSSAYVCAKYCKKHGVKFVIDVIDLWPDSLLPLTKGSGVIKTILLPWSYLTRYAYRHADVILGESVKYVMEAKKYNKKAQTIPIYLGVDMNLIAKVKTERPVTLIKPEDEVWIAYAGSLGVSYDFQTLLNAVKIINGKYKYKLWFIGDGVRRDEVATCIADSGLNAEITGFLPYQQLLGYLSYCDIAVNIFRECTKVVYSYKFNDYVAMNCFVLNSLEGETAQMVDEYQIGRNFNFSDKPLSSVLEDTLQHWNDYVSWRSHHQRLIDEKLDKEKIYSVVKEIFD